MTELLDSNLGEQKQNLRRRELLPWWIKIFIWIFLITSIGALIMIPAAFTGHNFNVSFYGIETSGSNSIVGLCLTGLYLFKGVTAFSLWTERDFAIVLGMIDAIVGILICIYMMCVVPLITPNPGFNIRLELVLLIPFLLKLIKIKKEWEERSVALND